MRFASLTAAVSVAQNGALPENKAERECGATPATHLRLAGR